MTYGCPAVSNLIFEAIPGDKHGVIGQTDDFTIGQHLIHRIFCRLPRVGVNNFENLRQLSAAGLNRRPACQFFSHGIHPGYRAMRIGGDDGITDGIQGDAHSGFAGHKRLFTLPDHSGHVLQASAQMLEFKGF